MNETTVTVAGNLVSDVELRTTARGDALARFRVAATAKRYDRASGRWLDGDTSYWNVTVWRRAAENAKASLFKGVPVVVHGRVRQRTVDRPVPEAAGVTMSVTFTDLEAVHFGLDLTRCRAQFQRAPVGPQTSGSTDRAGWPGAAGSLAGTGPLDPAGPLGGSGGLGHADGQGHSGGQGTPPASQADAA